MFVNKEYMYYLLWMIGLNWKTTITSQLMESQSRLTSKKENNATHK